MSTNLSNVGQANPAPKRTEKTRKPGTSMAEQAYLFVKEQILSGELPGQSLLSEGEIALRLNISRTPVREAFLRLQAEGWMQLYPKRGALVTPIPVGEKETVLEARELLEGHAARHICASPIRSKTLVVTLAEIINRQVAALAAKDGQAYARADLYFHQHVVQAGDNPILTAYYETLADRHRRMTSSSVWGKTAMARNVINDHQQLATAIAQGKPAAYSKILHDHLINSHHM